MNARRQLRGRLMNQSAAARRLALIDRDGTIIIDKVYLRDPDGIEFAPGAVEGLRLLRDAGFALVLITNQSGIARGYFDAARLEQIHDRLQSMLAAEGLSAGGDLRLSAWPGRPLRLPQARAGNGEKRNAGFGLRAGSGCIHRRQRRRHGGGGGGGRRRTCGSQAAAANPPRSAWRQISSKPRGARARCWLSGRAGMRGARSRRRRPRSFIAAPPSRRTRHCPQA